MHLDSTSRPLRAWIGAAALLLSLGCGSRQPGVTAPFDVLLSSDGSQGRGRILIVEDPAAPQWPSDPVTIRGALIDGDTLRLDVSFGGGCAEHRLQLLTNAIWMESYPVQTRARLAHDDGDDHCDSVVTGTLHFDLTPLRDAYHSSYGARSDRIRLWLDGYPGSLLYEF